MSKFFKYLALALVLILGSIVLFNLFSAHPGATSTPIANDDDNFAFTLVAAWGPSIVLIILYAIFLSMMKKLLRIVERIAIAVENNPVQLANVGPGQDNPPRS